MQIMRGRDHRLWSFGRHFFTSLSYHDACFLFIDWKCDLIYTDCTASRDHETFWAPSPQKSRKMTNRYRSVARWMALDAPHGTIIVGICHLVPSHLVQTRV